MKVIREKDQVRTFIASSASRKRGFVPTMGFLHAGHLSLIHQAKKICDEVVVSIYVNPAQFNDLGDFKSYPKNTERDLMLCEQAGVDLVYLPAELYLEGHDTWVVSTEWSKDYEGTHRPGHFQGVLTVVQKLFHLIEPRLAFFGKKDYQQFLLIKKMTLELDMNIDIIGAETVREKNGVALSSRNARLKQAQLDQAKVMIQGFLEIQRLYLTQKITSVEEAFRVFHQSLNKETNVVCEYFEVADKKNLVKQAILNEESLLMSAVVIEGVRLIDNLELVGNTSK